MEPEPSAGDAGGERLGREQVERHRLGSEEEGGPRGNRPPSPDSTGWSGRRGRRLFGLGAGRAGRVLVAARDGTSTIILGRRTGVVYRESAKTERRKSPTPGASAAGEPALLHGVADDAG